MAPILSAARETDFPWNLEHCGQVPERMRQDSTCLSNKGSSRTTGSSDVIFLSRSRKTILRRPMRRGKHFWPGDLCRRAMAPFRLGTWSSGLDPALDSELESLNESGGPSLSVASLICLMIDGPSQTYPCCTLSWLLLLVVSAWSVCCKAGQCSRSCVGVTDTVGRAG
jgi:hypothetical protein